MGFITEGFSIGLTIGTIGIGLTFAIPGVPPFYGFIGYSLFIMCFGEYYAGSILPNIEPERSFKFSKFNS
jgi:hypothetical protein